MEPVAVLAFGVLLLVVGLVGGDLSSRGFVVPGVGPLPRSTTTLAGLALVVLSLVVPAAEVSLPGDTDLSGTTSAAASLPEPAPVEQARAVAPTEPIVITVVDQLADGHASEQVELAVDGTHVGDLAVDEQEPTASLEVPLEGPGDLTYEVSVQGVTVLGEPYSAEGAATVEVDDGATLFVDLDPDTGQAGLVHEAAVR